MGGLITYAIQRASYRRDRRERHIERIREAYSRWCAALIEEVSATRLAITHREIVTQVPQPSEVLSILAAKSFEINLDWHNAMHKEQESFARVQLVDDERSRRDESQEIRLILKTFDVDLDQPGVSATSVARRFQAIEQALTERLSAFLATVRNSLNRDT